MEHTPTPWTIHDRGLVPRIVSGTEIICSIHTSHSADMMDNDAEFIVRACNAHDDLIAALEHAEEAIEQWSVIPTPLDADQKAQLKMDMHIISSALNKAKGV